MSGKKKGRKASSPIRDNMIELLYVLGQSYGYDLYKKYLRVYGPISLRSVYYHLNKGVELGVFKLKEVEKIKGDYSWGEDGQRLIYTLKSKANIKVGPKVLEKLNK